MVEALLTTMTNAETAAGEGRTLREVLLPKNLESMKRNLLNVLLVSRTQIGKNRERVLLRGGGAEAGVPAEVGVTGKRAGKGGAPSGHDDVEYQRNQVVRADAFVLMECIPGDIARWRLFKLYRMQMRCVSERVGSFD